MRNNLKRIRNAKGLKQEQVADDLGLSLSTYRSWEQGQRGINGKKLTILAEYFGVSTDTILGSEFAELSQSQILTLDETQLIEDYRTLNNDGKRIASEVLAALVQSDRYL